MHQDQAVVDRVPHIKGIHPNHWKASSEGCGGWGTWGQGFAAAGGAAKGALEEKWEKEAEATSFRRAEQNRLNALDVL